MIQTSKNPVLSRFDSTRNCVRQILEDVAEGVRRRTPFRRCLVTCYETPLIPRLAEPESKIAEYACLGLSGRQEREFLAFLAEGGTVSGLRYQPPYRIGDCYFYPRGEGLPQHDMWIPTTRRYVGFGTWQADDALLVPFWRNGHIVGQISLDDPRDGVRPRSATLQLLEQVASVAALALEDAAELEEMTERHQLFHLLTDCGLLGVLAIRNENERITYANEQALTILGYDEEEILNLLPWWQVLHADDRPFAWACRSQPPFVSKTIRAIRRDGRVIWLSACAHPLQVQDGEGLALQFVDMTDRVRTEELLKEKALRDPLTGFRNRGYFEDAIQTEIKRSLRYRRPFTLMMADLAGFKRVNDTLGHQEGDRVLAGIADVIRTQLRESDWVVRYGGDEFLLTLPETGPDVQTLVERLQASVEAWSREHVVDVEVGVDLGWSTWHPDNPQPVEQLLQEADERLYEMKRAQAKKRQR